MVYFDIAMLEGVGGISKLLEAVPLDRIVFGSYLPYFPLEAGLLKLRESPLGGFQRAAIMSGNVESALVVSR